MSLSAEFQNYEEVEKSMNNLKTIFDDYYKLLTDLNENVISNINVGDASALSSKLGGEFLADWADSAESFEKFKALFDSLYAEVAQTTVNNAKFEENNATNSTYS